MTTAAQHERIRGQKDAFCAECHMAFGLVDNSPLHHTCATCYEKLGQPALECDNCTKAILPGEEFHLRYACLCGNCAIAKGKHRDTVAWSDR